MKRLLLMLLILCSATTLSAKSKEYEKRVFVSSDGDSLNYRLLTPESVDPSAKYPLVIFLHGSGERGSDNEKQLTHGSEMFLNPLNREQYPAYVIFPQCPEEQFWGSRTGRPAMFTSESMPNSSDEIASNLALVKGVIESYLELPNVDGDRVYIVGLSMGAMGLFDLVSRHPELFAAAVPICGTVRSERLANAQDVSFRIFHGDADSVVPIDGSRAAYKALKAAGASVEYVEFAGCNHDSWNPAFNYPDFMEWIFKQRK